MRLFKSLRDRTESLGSYSGVNLFASWLTIFAARQSLARFATVQNLASFTAREFVVITLVSSVPSFAVAESPKADSSKAESSMATQSLAESSTSTSKSTPSSSVTSSPSGAQQCEGILAKDLLPNSTSGQKTVKYVGMLEDNSIVLSKWAVSSWASAKNLVKGSLTPQGEVRNPMLLLGRNLAGLFGFSIVRIKGTLPFKLGDQFFLIAPGAVKIGRKIKTANAYLKAHGYEPITYFPARAGLLESEEFLDLALDTSGDAELNFPYDDIDPNLAPHEISFHLGALLLNKKMLKRAHQINRHTKNFAVFLKAHSNEFGPAEKIASQLTIERTLELDFSTANIPADFSYQKSINPNLNFNEIWLKFIKNSTGERSLNSTVNQVDYLCRPSMTPLNALLMRIYLMTGVHSMDPGSETLYPRILYPRLKAGNEIKLSEKEKAKLKELALQYIQIHANDDTVDGPIEISSSVDWLKEWVLSLDERIRQLTEALSH